MMNAQKTYSVGYPPSEYSIEFTPLCEMSVTSLPFTKTRRYGVHASVPALASEYSPALSYAPIFADTVSLSIRYSFSFTYTTQILGN